MKPIGSALVGTGAIARSLHIAGHRACPDSRLLWVCDTNEEAAKAFSKEYGIPGWTTNLSDILRDPMVDWVDIATPNGTHEAIAVQALQAGKHVLCQKPMAHSLAAAERMVAAAAEAQRNLGIFMCFRGDGAYATLKRLIAQKQIGELISLRGKMISGNGFRLSADSWRNSEAAGALELLGVHLIDLFIGLAGPIQWVQAYSNTIRAPIQGDDVTTAIYGMLDGVSAVMETTYCSYRGPSTPCFYLEANGTDGYFRYRIETGELEIQMKNDDELAGQPYKADQLMHFRFPAYSSTTGIHEQFVRAIVRQEPPEVGGATGLEVMQVMSATRQAALEQRQITLCDASYSG